MAQTEEQHQPPLSGEAVSAFLAERPQFVQQWLRQRGSGVMAPQVVLRSRNSITDDLFRDLLEQRRGSPPPAASSAASGSVPLDENELMIDLIRDIANEFDIHLLCRKIMKNVGVLTRADRGSLFLAKGSRRHRYLVANVFEVMGVDEEGLPLQLKTAGEMRIPFGKGIAGYVAQTKEVVNLADAYLDPRFSPEVDEMTGYKTGSLLCMPLCNHAGEVIGVAEIINKQGEDCSEFTDADVQIFQKYLVFCGIGLQNAQLFDLSISEFKKNQILLNLARGIFEEQSSLENLVKKIMREAADLLHCEQAIVFLREDHHDENASGSELPFGAVPVRSGDQLSSGGPPSRSTSRESGTTDQAVFHQCFSLTTDGDRGHLARSLPEVEFRQLPFYDAALRVLETGETITSSECDGEGEGVGIHWHQDHKSAEIRSVLTIPIHNQSHIIIGVAHFINKENGYCFTDQDVRAVETFGVFCGLGIHNSQTYEHACRLMAKQRVALECLSYHATASAESTAELVSRHVPSALQLNLYSHQFDDMELDTRDTCTAAIRMFKDMNMIKKFRIPYEVLCRWILSVQKNYRPVKYHNWRHALNVTQTMFVLLRNGKMAEFISDQEVLGLMVACLSHDLDHRGTNNAFQSKTDSPLAMLYSTSTMEHHHFDQCVMILNSEGNNIFQVLKPGDYRRVIDTVQQAILSTDLEQYFKTKDQFLQIIQNGQPDWHNEHKKLLMGMLMTACDVSAITKPWEIQHRVAKQVADEFFYQGDLERTKLNAQPSAMMDRERRDELPKMQMEFINLICIPLYSALSEAFPWMRPMCEGCLQNLKHWQHLADQVDMGLTWIDRDSIEEPVETSRDLSVSRITLQGKIPESPANKPERTLSVRLNKPSRSNGSVSPQSQNSTTVSTASADRRSSAPPAPLGRHRRFGRSTCRRHDQETRLCAIS